MTVETEIRWAMRELEDDLKPLLGTVEVDTSTLKSNVKNKAGQVREESRAVVRKITSAVRAQGRTAGEHVRPRIRRAMATTIHRTISELEKIED